MLRITYSISVSLAAILMYLLISYVVLNGRIFYNSSFSSENIEDSIQRELFIEKINALVPENKVKNFQFWKEKHYKINYYGILFSSKELVANKLKLRMEGESLENLCCDIWVDDKLVEDKVPFPYTSFIIKSNEKVEYRVKKCKKDSVLFTLRYSDK